MKLGTTVREPVSLVFALVAMCLCASPALGQSYGMSFSIYRDAYASSDLSTLHMWTTVSDNSWGCTHSNYNTVAHIVSPTGRNSYHQSTGLSSSTSITINDEMGDYTISTSGTYYCSCSYQTLGFGGGEILGVSIHISYFTDGFAVPLGCHYPSLACIAGTATCSAGWTLGFYTGCPKYVVAGFLVLDFAYVRICNLGSALSSPVPGVCN